MTAENSAAEAPLHGGDESRQVQWPIAPCLWFDDQAEEAAAFYCSVFPNSRIQHTTYYTEIGQEFHQKPVGSVMTVEFELNGQPFTALNGGPVFSFNEAVSLQIVCRTQEEIDHYWHRLGEGGDPSAQQCGWLKDRFGVSWQVSPSVLREILSGSDREGASRALSAMFAMKKIDIGELLAAYHGA
jgi:predicted 3-demethylubiquinone-9 3-methyltransferase (glyoxalase superfamily)